VAHKLERDLWLPLSRPQVFAFFSCAENLERITPPWVGFRFVTPTPIDMKVGAAIEYVIRVHGVAMRWRTRIVAWNPPFEFVDVQERGPYRMWRHTHRFIETGGGTRIEDEVDYELPLGVLGRLVHRLQVSRDLRAIFDYRAKRVEELLRGSG
jgi:ligand-binding SRPBCC domain-containing protein